MTSGQINFSEMQNEVQNIVTRNHVDIDLDKIFVFSCYALLGVFFFYRLDEGENPPVYTYIEGEATYKKTHNHFTDFLKSEDWYQGWPQRYNF